RPEGDEHHLAAERSDRERAAVEPVAVGLEVRSGAVVGQRARRRRLRLLAAAQLVELTLRRLARLDVLLQRLRVAGKGGLEACVGIQGDRERDETDHAA